MHAIAYAVLSGWVAFWFYWLVAALSSKQSTRQRLGSFAGGRVAVVLVALLLLRSGVFRGHSATVEDPWLQGIGVVVFFSGLALAVWARICLGTNWGTPMSEKVDAELVTSGPYHRVRHPIYSGIILAMIGSGLAVSWYWLVAAVLVGSYFVYSSFVEERTMVKLFPGAYAQYRLTTKRLIPFVF